MVSRIGRAVIPALGILRAFDRTVSFALESGKPQISPLTGKGECKDRDCPFDHDCSFGHDYPLVRRSIYVARRYEAEYQAWKNGRRAPHRFK